MKNVQALLLGCLISTASFAQNSHTSAKSQTVVSAQTLTIDASDKTNFVYLGLEDGKLVPVAETDTWIFGVRRYIFKTQTGSNGAFTGGAYVGAQGEDFKTVTSCEGKTFEADQVISMLGYTISANSLITSEWYDYDDTGAVTPLDKVFAISRDSDCFKFKILSYATGVYEIQYEQLNLVR
ncbi:MAG: HmuY family protein [Bdellovibrionota bacterium]